MTPGQKMKALRARYQLSQKEMARRLDLSVPVLSKLENGKKPFLYNHAERLLEAFPECDLRSEVEGGYDSRSFKNENGERPPPPGGKFDADAARIKTQPYMAKRRKAESDDHEDKSAYYLTFYEKLAEEGPPEDPLALSVWAGKIVARALQLTITGYGDPFWNGEIVKLAKTVKDMLPSERLLQLEKQLVKDKKKMSEPKAKDTAKKVKRDPNDDDDDGSIRG